MNKKVVFVAVVLFLSATVFAAKRDFADELSKTMLPMDQYNQMIGGIVQNGEAMAQAKVDQEKLKVDVVKEKAKIKKSLQDSFSYKYFIGKNSTTMRKNFTDAELEKILAFYETEVGKKWIKHTPEIISDTMTGVQADLQVQMPKLVEAIGPKKKNIRSYRDES